MDKFAEILTVAKQPALKSQIIQKCGLSNETFNQYIHRLLESGLLDAYPAIDLKHMSGPKSHHRMVYQTSKKGMEFLKRYNELLTLLKHQLNITHKLNFNGNNIDERKTPHI